MKKEKKFEWTFVVDGEEYQIISTERKEDALAELSHALGMWGNTRETRINCVRQRRAREISRKRLDSDRIR
jgi:hypothetical protein